ncbi:MAG: type II toxin-antitoxin system MqsA family antitoxin [Ruminococcus sp.]|uniref:Type II toxin-antitoxin system MqsA family antitoxin n=2 Tax=Schaedlerella arabinosiphila TaxID=2044587 RepID=A0A3R8M3E6_9FIRM|nr:type II toxin-antitoxin system MqsA family antitoxin [Ruminococcus sp.]RRK35142.1 type II toxin-antitoxin system MqsA family antitoxin [Schaedlerella arabinosiphila]
MRCACCKIGQMEETKTTYFAELKDCYVIIENVPCMKCGQCGEVVFRNSIAEKIDDILDDLEKIVSKISIIDYSKVA